MDTTHYIVQRSMRDITGRAISVAASPNVTGSAGSNIYPVLAPQNKIIDTDYRGDVNIMGNVPVQIMNSPNSAFLEAFDIAHFPIGIHYRYMAIQPTDANVMLNRQIVKAMAEAYSSAYAETFTNLGFFAAKYSAGTRGVPPLLGESDPEATEATYLGPIIFYQTVLQNVLMLDAKYKSTMSLESTAVAQAWLREVPELKRMFGLLKKKELVSYLSAISSLLPGNAVDTDWAQQVNVLCNIPSKRSNSYEDPLIVMDAITTMPKYLDVWTPDNSTLGSKRSWFYDALSVDGEIPVLDGTKSRYWVDFTVKQSIDGERNVRMVRSIEQLFFEAVNLLSPYYIIKLARKIYLGNAAPSEIQNWFNYLVTVLEQITYCLKTFSSDFSDLNVVLKVMQRVGLNNWKFGVVPKDNVHIDDYIPVYNKLLYDVFSATLAGGDTMVWDDEVTKRWRFFTIWSMEKDIPNYDLSTGGSFLTFSTREVPREENYQTKMKYCIPILFRPVQASRIEFLNRNNREVAMDSITLTAADIANNPVIARIMAIPTPSMTLRMPIFISTGNKLADSFLMKTITNICGMVSLVNQGGTLSPSGLSGTLLDTAVMCALDIEMDDISNVMINQARVSSPWRVATMGSEDSVGFMGVIS